MLKKQGLLFIQSAICNLQFKIFCHCQFQQDEASRQRQLASQSVRGTGRGWSGMEAVTGGGNSVVNFWGSNRE